MASDGGHSAGSLVYWIAPPWAAQSGLLLLYRKQHFMDGLGMACTSVGIDCASGSAVSYEPQGLEKEHSSRAAVMTSLKQVV